MDGLELASQVSTNKAYTVGNEDATYKIAALDIGIKKNISLVEIPGSILVVGVSNDNISLLTKIEDKIALDVLRQETSRLAPSFSDHLQRLTGRFKQTRNSSEKRV